jgi:hypothetical protein
VEPNEVCPFLEFLSTRLAEHPHLEVDIIFGPADGHTGYSTESASPYLTITVSSNASPSMTAAGNALNPASANLENPAAEGRTTRFTDQVNDETIQPTSVTPPLSPLSPTTDLPVESDTAIRPVASNQTEKSLIALRHAEESIDTMKTWTNAVETVKRVMDAVSPIAEV